MDPWARRGGSGMARERGAAAGQTQARLMLESATPPQTGSAAAGVMG
jgi:hypothetical protein